MTFLYNASKLRKHFSLFGTRGLVRICQTDTKVQYLPIWLTVLSKTSFQGQIDPCGIFSLINRYTDIYINCK